MDYITVSGVLGYDGRYGLDIEAQGFTVQEFGWIKRLSGYLPLTIDEGYQGADAELFAVFALIAMVRNGKVAEADAEDVFDKLRHAPMTAITFEGDASEDADASPPASPENSGSNGTSSGESSTTSSETLEHLQQLSGTPASATSPSVPVTSPR